MAKDEQSEMTRQFRELTERNLEQARAAYNQYFDTVAKAMGAWTQAPAAMTGLREVQDLTIRLARENAEAAFALGSKLANAKDLQDVVNIQSRYAQEQIQAYGRQAEELSQVLASAASQASEASPKERPPKPKS
jgi:hypothetical protein